MKYSTLGKRLLDLGVSTVVLTACLPFFGVFAALIKFTSAGPVFFRQERMGKDGRLFRVFKFRTMTSMTGNPLRQFTPGELERITPVGRVLRRCKIDELPQLFNVLAGEMSLVGPRPEVPEYSQYYRGEWMGVLSVKPGMTDPASVKYHGEEALLSRSRDPESFYRQVVLPDKLRLNKTYTLDVRFAGDLKILWETFRVLVLARES